MLKKAKKAEPLTNGRNRRGQFGCGNRLSKGHRKSGAVTHAKQLKQALLEAVTVADMKAIAKELITKAKKGDSAAAKELFDRCLGKPHQTHGVEVDARKYSPEECDSVRAILAERCN